jgi:hypothetical protein
MYAYICDVSYSLERSDETDYCNQNISLFEVDETLSLVDVTVIYLEYILMISFGNIFACVYKRVVLNRNKANIYRH